ncbi:exp1-like protein [Geranomyces michiganensis]|nr:exp1-like protein [Geranomyces michiganensis]
MLMHHPRFSTAIVAASAAATSTGSFRCFNSSAAVAKELTPAQIARKKIKALGKPEVAPPKSRNSAYLLFIQAEREKIIQDLGTTQFGPVSKEAGARWRALSEGEREPWHELSFKDKERYDREYANFLATRPASDAILDQKIYRLRKTLPEEAGKIRRKPIKDSQKPKVLSAFHCFSKKIWDMDMHGRAAALGQDSLEGKGFGDVAKLIAGAWKSMSDQEKQPYQRQSDKMKAASREYIVQNGLDDFKKSIDKAINEVEKQGRKKPGRRGPKKSTKKVTTKRTTKKKSAAGSKRKASPRTKAKKTTTRKTRAATKTKAKTTATKTKKAGDAAEKAVKAVRKGVKAVGKSIKNTAKAAKTVTKRAVHAATD